jgi:prepilin-type N-terminal cleavage/methylation domain-containing protein
MKKGGFSLIEIIVAISIFAVVIFAASQLLLTSQEVTKIGNNKVKAIALQSEYLEKVRNLRQYSWGFLTNGRYILKIDQDGDIFLEATTSGEIIDNFTRFLEIEDAYRDQEGRLVTSGGILDPSIKKVTVFVSWTDLHPGTFSQTTYLTRYRENLAWKQTSIADFEAGEMDFTKIKTPPLNDGEVQLMGGCSSGSPQSLIYDDQLRNGWRANCDGLPFWQWLICKILQFFNNGSLKTDATEYTYQQSPYSMKAELKPPSSGAFWSWVRLNNFNGVCTVGFRNLHFYAYNPSSQQIDFWVTAVYPHWENSHVILSPGGWAEISLDYKQVNESYENNLQSIYFSRFLSAGQPAVVFYVDQMDLTGGVGGYFTEGTLTSSVLDTGHSSAFNRIDFTGQQPTNTQIGFQAAASNDSGGPWLFYGPGGTGLATDLYLNPEGQGIWLGANLGRYLRYKAFLKSFDGKETPILYDVTINYSP